MCTPKKFLRAKDGYRAHYSTPAGAALLSNPACVHFLQANLDADTHQLPVENPATAPRLHTVEPTVDNEKRVTHRGFSRAQPHQLSLMANICHTSCILDN